MKALLTCAHLVTALPALQTPQSIANVAASLYLYCQRAHSFIYSFICYAEAAFSGE